MRPLMELDNIKVIPNYPEHVCQRGNYVSLIERILVNEIPCLEFCKNVVMMHIPHTHEPELSKKSEKVWMPFFQSLEFLTAPYH